MAVDAATLPPHQFRHVRFFLRHDRAAGAETVGNVDEAETRAHPQDQLFRQARQVGHGQCGGGGEFNGEITVGYRIQRVFAHSVETSSCAV